MWGGQKIPSKHASRQVGTIDPYDTHNWDTIVPVRGPVKALPNKSNLIPGPAKSVHFGWDGPIQHMRDHDVGASVGIMESVSFVEKAGADSWEDDLERSTPMDTPTAIAANKTTTATNTTFLFEMQPILFASNRGLSLFASRGLSLSVAPEKASTCPLFEVCLIIVPML